jgi:hypothetical protein
MSYTLVIEPFDCWGFDFMGPFLAAPPWCESTPELVSVPVSSCDFVSMYNFRLYNPPESPRSVYHFLVVFCFELFLSGIALSFGVTMFSSGPSEENPLADSINPYTRELKMHPKELLLKDRE